MIYNKHEDKLAALNSVEYFKIFIENLQKKCKQAVKLFKDGKEKESLALVIITPVIGSVG